MPTVEVAGEIPGAARQLTRRSPVTVRLSLPTGLPPAAFVLVRNDDQWLDRRFLKWSYARETHPDVEEELVEIEPATKLELFLIERENDQAEFKRILPGETDDHKRTVMKTVAAFANGNGGILLFGITKEYEVVGVPAEGIDDAKDRLSDLIDSWVAPRPRWGFETLPLDQDPHVVVLALHVEAGDEPPYSIGTANSPTQYYVRHAARSVPARPNELRALARSVPLPRAPEPGSAPPWI